MPLASQGKILGLVEEDKDIVSVWLMMKRGCRVYLMAKDEELVEPLRTWDPNLKLIDHPKRLFLEQFEKPLTAMSHFSLLTK